MEICSTSILIYFIIVANLLLCVAAARKNNILLHDKLQINDESRTSIENTKLAGHRKLVKEIVKIIFTNYTKLEIQNFPGKIKPSKPLYGLKIANVFSSVEVTYIKNEDYSSQSNRTNKVKFVTAEGAAISILPVPTSIPKNNVTLIGSIETKTTKIDYVTVMELYPSDNSEEGENYDNKSSTLDSQKKVDSRTFSARPDFNARNLFTTAGLLVNPIEVVTVEIETATNNAYIETTDYEEIIGDKVRKEERDEKNGEMSILKPINILIPHQIDKEITPSNEPGNSQQSHNSALHINPLSNFDLNQEENNQTILDKTIKSSTKFPSHVHNKTTNTSSKSSIKNQKNLEDTKRSELLENFTSNRMLGSHRNTAIEGQENHASNRNESEHGKEVVLSNQQPNIKIGNSRPNQNGASHLSPLSNSNHNQEEKAEMNLNKIIKSSIKPNLTYSMTTNISFKKPIKSQRNLKEDLENLASNRPLVSNRNTAIEGQENHAFNGNESEHGKGIVLRINNTRTITNSQPGLNKILHGNEDTNIKRGNSCECHSSGFQINPLSHFDSNQENNNETNPHKKTNSSTRSNHAHNTTANTSSKKSMENQTNLREDAKKSDPLGNLASNRTKVSNTGSARKGQEDHAPNYNDNEDRKGVQVRINHTKTIGNLQPGLSKMHGNEGSNIKRGVLLNQGRPVLFQGQKLRFENDDAIETRAIKNAEKMRRKKKKHNVNKKKNKRRKKKKMKKKKRKVKKIEDNTTTTEKNKKQDGKRRRAPNKHKKRKKRKKKGQSGREHPLPEYKNIEIQTLRPKRIQVLKDWKDQDAGAIHLESIAHLLLERARGSLGTKKLKKELLEFQKDSSKKTSTTTFTNTTITTSPSAAEKTISTIKAQNGPLAVTPPNLYFTQTEAVPTGPPSEQTEKNTQTVSTIKAQNGPLAVTPPNLYITSTIKAQNGPFAVTTPNLYLTKTEAVPTGPPSEQTETEELHKNGKVTEDTQDTTTAKELLEKASTDEQNQLKQRHKKQRRSSKNKGKKVERQTIHRPSKKGERTRQKKNPLHKH